MTDLEPCPFCGQRLVRSEFLSTRLNEVYAHPAREDGELCILHDIRISMQDHPDAAERRAKWNIRALPPGGEAVAWVSAAMAHMNTTGKLSITWGELASLHHRASGNAGESPTR